MSKTIGQLLTEAITLNELKAEVIERELAENAENTLLKHTNGLISFQFQ